MRHNKSVAVSLISTTSHIAQLRMSQHIINAASHAGKRCAHSQANMRYAINRCARSLVAEHSCQTRADFSRFPISFAFFLNRALTKGYHTKCWKSSNVVSRQESKREHLMAQFENNACAFSSAALDALLLCLLMP